MTSSYFEGGGEAVSSLKPPRWTLKAAATSPHTNVAFLYGFFLCLFMLLVI